MSAYGLIKAESRIMRQDTIEDLTRINYFLYSKGLPCISVYGPSVRALENSVALGLEKVDTKGLQKLVRSEDFYNSILPEIKESERNKFNLKNRKHEK